ncbi:alpha mannosidase middle domain-containing protein [Ditylenchus destructor]|uniref:alpha-mannosidase n=1 Tax=Ditylenchus destructor TaxID=166010 RepID=A0AAD4N4S9_9BILA|nr:alpha mannosidase middle domain-containing protein [Ditylenchus destructor]
MFLGRMLPYLYLNLILDAGWIKTADDYYTGARRDLVPIGVQFILNSVVEELSADPRRRFSYAETAFLQMWLENQPPAKVKRFHELVVEKGCNRMKQLGQPDGLCFDVVCNSDQDDPVIDNPALEGYNVHKKLQILVDYVNKLLTVQRHSHVLVTMGNDFTYSSANMCYMMAINEAAPHLSVKNDDFFPYASNNNSYWTGYFTSKPVLKGLVRKSSAFLQLVRQLNAFSYQKDSDPRQDVFERAVALSQHHDAITGTSKENVTRDYERRLFHAWDVGELLKTFRRTQQLHNSNIAPYEISFVANVPPLGFATYFLTNKTENRWVLFQWRNDLMNNKSYSLRQEFFYYVGMTNGSSSNGKRASGAYIFRPNGTTAWPTNTKIEMEVIKTSLFQEVRQRVSPWISQVIRLLPNKSYVEFDYLVGPIPKNDSNLTTMEVITRYTVTGLASKGIFKTDANGRQLMERRKNNAVSYEYENTEPVSGNYYPVNSRIILSDEQTQMTVLTDRSHGGSSLIDGQIEIMLHRRAYWDDDFGVNEPLDEPGEDGRGLVVRGTHWLLLGPKSPAHRPLAFELFHHPIISFAQIGSIEAYIKKFLTTFSPLSADLPPHVNLLTLKQLKSNSLLLRLEHFYQNQEDNFFSQPISVDLTKLFSPFDIITVEELMLAGNKLATSNTQTNEPNKQQNKFSERRLGAFSVELKPMEIKTLRIAVHMKTITN